MDMKLDIVKLSYCAHHYEEENFEDFDDIYDSVRMGEVEFEEDDIVKLCDIFTIPFDDIHPQQYIKIVRITFLAIKQIGIDRGLEKLIDGLEKLTQERYKSYLYDYLKMFKCSYSKEDVDLFIYKLKKLPIKERKYIVEVFDSIEVKH